MMDRSWYHTGPRVLLLADVVREWLGTPFLLNGRAKGEGAGCAGVLAGIHAETGALPADLDLPIARGTWSDQLTLARMGGWIDQHRALFARRYNAQPEVGDLVLFRSVSGQCHLGAWLGNWDGQSRSLVHASPHQGVTTANLLDPTYADRVEAVWSISHEEARA